MMLEKANWETLTKNVSIGDLPNDVNLNATL